MPASVMSLFPNTIAQIKAARFYHNLFLDQNKYYRDYLKTTFGILGAQLEFGLNSSQQMFESFQWHKQHDISESLSALQQSGQAWFRFLIKQSLASHRHQQSYHQANFDFFNCFLQRLPHQQWHSENKGAKVMLELPSLRLIDLSEDLHHSIQNYTVVFAPRAGHHSNIAEATAVFMRNQGLSRMAVVEQKCAEDIPLYIDGKRHYENFDSQVKQYREVLSFLKSRSGVAPHLVAVCQPGPILMATLIQNPSLGKTFGSAGSPMHTEAETGFLTEFSRLLGESYIDRLIDLFPLKVPDSRYGAGRLGYDGRLHILGFYLLGLNTHLANLMQLYRHFHTGDDQAVERQIAFYEWYNTVHHLPAGFIKDTFKKVFVRNELVQGKLIINGQKISIADYPANVPIWALGGTNDKIAPPGQATGHLKLLNQIPPENKLKLICDAGHMGLFRSQRILDQYYQEIAAFLYKHSDFPFGAIQTRRG